MSTTWCRFEVDGKQTHGRIDGDTVIAIEGLPWAEHRETAQRHPLSAVKLLAPVVPSTFYCVGLNYPEHLTASAKRRGVEPQFPKRPDVNYRANNALCGQNDAIVKPRDA